ncbi:hypothetical protein QBC36DRAFT_70845 [Triangularia setosa]|uniref:Zn(2)-C6 fungal-type domain-containing protein n=1 Tax=Triangularia setosa TaxID=2587417 RepID=A0AAN6VZK9_9PEZI|nr:hypothetical protein QBC36DRAFT_70845 [Podospora setosa]
MADPDSASPHTIEMEPPRKKLRVRKGTKSCWECKRRKVRCIFSAATSDVCDGCERRRSTCISQEFPDVVALHNTGDTEDRLGRVEVLVEDLARKIDSVNSNPKEIDDRVPCLEQPPLPSDPEFENGRQAAEYRRIVFELLGVWPDKTDLDLILDLPLQSSLRELLFKVGGILFATVPDPVEVPLRDVLEQPPPGTHPVLIARKLLFLGLFLQDVPPSCAKHLEGLTAGYHDLMSQAVERVISLVTSNDQLIDSIEGIECIMMESMYHDRAGNLRRSWTATRRAMTMAQLMGLHRGARSKSCLNTSMSSTRTNIDSDYLWSRIVQSDRYLSLMLGLPQGSPDNSFATPEALEASSPADRLRRLHCIVAGHILHRNDLRNLSSTREIDDLLQRASACMPPQWWLAPDVASHAGGDDLEAPNKTFRLMNQAVHHHLLAQLHLPYLLRPSFDQRCTYSKITAVNASREVLTRFIIFRKANPISSYCHGIDFLAFIASTALSIAHLDAHGQKAQAEMGNDILNFLAHQRQADRGILEATLEAVEHMSVNGQDAIAQRIATALRHLLSIEAEAAVGGLCSYSSNSGENDEEIGELECNGKMTDDGKLLRIHIPYLGRILVRRGDDISNRPTDTTNPDGHMGTETPIPEVQMDFVQDWDLQGVDTAFFDNLLRGVGGSDFVGFE